MFYILVSFLVILLRHLPFAAVVAPAVQGDMGEHMLIKLLSGYTVSGIGFDLTALLLSELSVGGSPVSWTSTCSCSRSPSPILSPNSLGPHPLSYPLPLQQQAEVHLSRNLLVLLSWQLWLRLLGRRDLRTGSSTNRTGGHPLMVLGCLWTLEAETLLCPSQGFS